MSEISVPVTGKSIAALGTPASTLLEHNLLKLLCVSRPTPRLAKFWIGIIRQAGRCPALTSHTYHYIFLLSIE